MAAACYLLIMLTCAILMASSHSKGQDCSHAMILRFTMYGQLYTACDMTSPDATVLVRQYQNAVFMPIMRVHQMHGKPRFPFLWGGAEHQAAFRQALNMRYAFLPFMYSLAHHGHRHGRPIGHPASFEFPSTMERALGDATYMVGGVILPADVSTSHGTTGENATMVNLPPAASKGWYRWNTTHVEAGNQTLAHTVAIAEMVVYVREGAILPLQATAIQYSDLIGGLLQVQVYAGADGIFEMVEDDGMTLDYITDSTGSTGSTTGSGAVAAGGGTKTTHWSWDNEKKVLSYTVDGTFAGNNDYTEVQAVLFEAGASAPQYAPVQKLASAGGSIAF